MQLIPQSKTTTISVRIGKYWDFEQLRILFSLPSPFPKWHPCYMVMNLNFSILISKAPVEQLENTFVLVKK